MKKKEIEDIFNELEDCYRTDSEPEEDEVSIMSVLSTPRPALRPFFSEGWRYDVSKRMSGFNLVDCAECARVFLCVFECLCSFFVFFFSQEAEAVPCGHKTSCQLPNNQRNCCPITEMHPTAEVLLTSIDSWVEPHLFPILARGYLSKTDEASLLSTSWSFPGT